MTDKQKCVRCGKPLSRFEAHNVGHCAEWLALQVAELRKGLEQVEKHTFYWIRTSERLPDKPGRYFTLRGLRIGVDAIYAGMEEKSREWWIADGITHWAEPPELY